MDDRILTLNLGGKQGVSISRQKYDIVRAAILAAFHRNGDLTFKEMMTAVEADLAGRFDGSVSWYTTCVKLDLEARGEILVVRGAGQQRLRLPTAG